LTEFPGIMGNAIISSSKR